MGEYVVLDGSNSKKGKSEFTTIGGGGSTGGSTIKKISKAETQAKNLKSKLNNYSTKILEVKEQLSRMMKGTNGNAYWQGDNAADWYLSAIKQLNKMMGNYNNSYGEFEDFAILLDKGKTKSKYKGKGGAALKALVASRRGTTYTAGIKYKNMDRERMSLTLPPTVSRDATNDDQNKESYRAYNNVKTALRDLSKICDSISKNWEDVAVNTKGTMHTDAKKRAKYIIERRREIDNTINNLESSYIGDIIFSR